MHNFASREKCRQCKPMAAARASAAVPRARVTAARGNGLPPVTAEELATSPDTSIKKAKEALAAGRSAGLDAEVIAALEQQVTQRLLAKASAVPLGAQLDSAKARVRRTEAACEQATAATATAAAALHAARERETQATTAKEAATHELQLLVQKAGECAIGTPRGTAPCAVLRALRDVLAAVERAWTTPDDPSTPAALIQAVTAAQSVLTPAAAAVAADNVDCAEAAHAPPLQPPQQPQLPQLQQEHSWAHRLSKRNSETEAETLSQSNEGPATTLALALVPASDVMPVTAKKARITTLALTAA